MNSTDLPQTPRKFSEHFSRSDLPASSVDKNRGRSSGQGPGGAQWISEPSTSNTSPAAITATLTAQPPATGATSASSTQLQTATASAVHKSSMILTPVSQISRGPRRTSHHKPPTSDHPSSYDPELYNPDGSLRTVHKLPSFDQSYADARNTRYIRHRERSESEKELSVDQIFEKYEHS